MTPETESELPRRRSDHIDLFVAKRIKERRRQLKLSQQEVAERLGISYQQVQKYENGSNRVTAGKLYAIATILEVSVNSFYRGLEDADDEGILPKAGSQISQLSNRAVKVALTDLVEAIAQADTRKERIDLP